MTKLFKKETGTNTEYNKLKKNIRLLQQINTNIRRVAISEGKQNGIRQGDSIYKVFFQIQYCGVDHFSYIYKTFFCNFI